MRLQEAEAIETPVAPGEVEVTARVTVTWAIAEGNA